MTKKQTTQKQTTKKTTRKAATAQGKPHPKHKGILSIAAEMLVRSKQPMSAKEIIERALKQGLWVTNGKTPVATLSSAIIREISAKGKDARFQKVDRGLFTAKADRK